MTLPTVYDTTPLSYDCGACYMKYQEVIENMTDFEKSIYEEICSWVKQKYGSWVNPSIDFQYFCEQYWKEKLQK